MESLRSVVDSYDPSSPLAEAWTIPAPWYTDPRVAALERRTVFGANWVMAARSGQLAEPGRFVTADVAGEPVVLTRGVDGELRAFFNVCRHHAAAVASEPEGKASVLRCPYHGWTYGLDGRLKGTPEFDGVGSFDRGGMGLAPSASAEWRGLIFVRLSPTGPSLAEQLGGLEGLVETLGEPGLRFYERRAYTVESNWKVFVDNYLDGGYHIPTLHKSLRSVIDFHAYTIENGGRWCLQSAPMIRTGEDARAERVRRGEKARFYWIYPNLMIDLYGNAADTNLVLPFGVDRCLVLFDFYFPEGEESSLSIAVGEQIQREDEFICASVQRGLQSRAYVAGRLSVRREAGEQLFHRLLHADLKAALEQPEAPCPAPAPTSAGCR